MRASTRPEPRSRSISGMRVCATSALGFIALLGQAVLNGVLVVSAFQARRAAGDDLFDAVVCGARDRLRAVLMTALLASPGLVPAALIAVAGQLAQSGWVFAPSRLTLDWSRLSPSHGLQRLKPSQSGINVLKTLLIAAAVGWIAYMVIRQTLASAPQLAWMTPASASLEGWRRLSSLLNQAGFALLFFAALDFGVQRWRHFSSLKMTKQEVKDEARLNEGNPEIKGRVRRIQREMSRRRMLSAVPTATVVITNPTHYAVAIKYERTGMSAPVVVAKGQDHLALKIRAIARDKGVPIVENVPLAQALYKGAEVGDQIPGALFGAVAEVLAYLVRIRQLML